MASTGNYNEAFKKALSLNDLSMVMLACQSVNPGQMFGQETCPLNQSVILSLIQQLSCNLQVSKYYDSQLHSSNLILVHSIILLFLVCFSVSSNCDSFFLEFEEPGGGEGGTGYE